MTSQIYTDVTFSLSWLPAPWRMIIYVFSEGILSNRVIITYNLRSSGRTNFPSVTTPFGSNGHSLHLYSSYKYEVRTKEIVQVLPGRSTQR